MEENARLYEFVGSSCPVDSHLLSFTFWLMWRITVQGYNRPLVVRSLLEECFDSSFVDTADLMA